MPHLPSNYIAANFLAANHLPGGTGTAVPTAPPATPTNGNAILAFPNYPDSTYVAVAFSGGSWQPALPLANLRNRELAKVARSTAATLVATQFQVDLGVTRGVRVFAIPKHTLSAGARIRIRGSATAGVFTSPVYDTGWLDVWPRIYAPGSLPWGHPSFWTGRLSAEDAEGYNIGFVHVAADVQTARYWLWEIDDTANPDGYVDLARLFMASGWQPSINMEFGAGYGWEDATTSQQSLGGVEYYDERPRRRVFAFMIGNLPVDEALTQPFEMQRLLGKAGQLFFVFNPTDTYHMHRRSFLATMRELSPLQLPYHDASTAAFTLQEVL